MLLYVHLHGGGIRILPGFPPFCCFRVSIDSMRHAGPDPFVDTKGTSQRTRKRRREIGNEGDVVSCGREYKTRREADKKKGRIHYKSFKFRGGNSMKFQHLIVGASRERGPSIGAWRQLADVCLTRTRKR